MAAAFSGASNDDGLRSGCAGAGLLGVFRLEVPVHFSLAI
jgi:hypothetical protein